MLDWIVVLQIGLALGIGALCWRLLGIVREAQQTARRIRRHSPDDRRR
ncbi:MAG: hypothetical protein HC828_10825 [Blastochloris sp.]|nr:hypothetical protein [Blastochloris sp.]